MTYLPAPQSTPFPTPQSLLFPSPTATNDPMFGVNPYQSQNMYIPGASGLDMSVGLPDLQTRAAQQKQLMQMAQLSSLGLAPPTDPHTWTPDEAAAQTDNAIAKIATVDPAAAERLAAQRTPGQDSGGGFWDSLKHLAGEILAPGLQLGGKILDIVARTASIVPNIAFDAVNGGDFNFFGDVGGALSGSTRHNWNSVFQEMGWDGGGIGGFLRATIGFAGDIATDPLTWVIPAGAGAKAADAAALTAREAATHATTITERAAILFGKDGTQLTEHLTGIYDDLMHGARAKGYTAGGDGGDIISGLIAQQVGEDSRTLVADMFNIADRTYRGVRARGFSTWARKGTIAMSDGSVLSGRDLVSVLEKGVRDGNFSGKLIGSASGDWKAARQLASSLGGVRLKVNLPFTNLRYISPAMPFSKLITEKTVGFATRAVAGQSGMNRMLAAIGKGEGDWSDMTTWMEQGFNAAFDKNPDLVKNLRGRFKNLGSMYYAASEAMGGITGHLDSGARATRAGLAGYIAHSSAIEAQATFARIVREVAYETKGTTGRMDRQTFLRKAESTLGLSFRKKGATATQEQMFDMARYLDWFPPGVDVSDPAKLEEWFWSTPNAAQAKAGAVNAADAPYGIHVGGDELARQQAKLADMKSLVERLDPQQRELLNHMSEMWHNVRGEAAKRDAMMADVRSNFERAGVLVPAQADEWAMGTHPLLQQDFFIDTADAGRNTRVRYNGVAEADIGAHDGVAGIHASRSSGGGHGIGGPGQVRARLRGADWIVVDETPGAALTDEQLILDVRAGADSAAENTRAAAGAAVPNSDLPIVSDLEKAQTSATMATEALHKQRPDASGVIYKRANGDVEVTVFNPADIKVVDPSAAHLVPSERGYYRRTLTKDAKEWLRGKVPMEGRQVLIAEPEIAAYLSRQTLNMDLGEAEAFIRRFLTDTYGEAAANTLPPTIWNINPLEVHEEYLAHVGEAVQAEMLGKASKRIVQMGDVQPAMFGSSPRSQKYDWMLHPSLLSTLAKKDAKLTRAIMASHQRDAARMEGEHAVLNQTATDYGMFAAMVEESLANGVEVPSRYVAAARKYGSTRVEAETRIADELAGIGTAEATLRDHVTAYDAAAEQLASDPAYGHPRAGQEIQIEDLPDGRQRIRGWHFTDRMGLPPEGTRGIDMSYNGFHFGDFDTALARAKVELDSQGKTHGWRNDPTSWPTERVEQGGLGDPLAFNDFAAYEQASADAGVPVTFSDVPVQPDVFYDDVMFPVEVDGNFLGAGKADPLPVEGSLQQGGLGITFTGSGTGETVQKAIDRGQLQSKGHTGALYTNSVEGTGTMSVVVLEPGDVHISHATERFAEDVKAGKLYRQADGTVSARRTAGSKKLIARDDATQQLQDLANRTQELNDIQRSLAHGADDVVYPTPHTGALDHSGAVGNGGQLVYRGVPSRVRTGQNDGTRHWFKSLFASHDEEVARSYAGDEGAVERILLKPEAKVLVEDSQEFIDMVPASWYSDTYIPGSILPGAEHGAASELDQLTEKARAAGYDAIQMKDQDGLGTAILNEAAVIRQYRRDPITRSVGDVGTAAGSVARTGTAAAEALGKRQLAAGKKLERLRRNTHLAMTEANRAYAEFHGARAAIKPALVKVETAGDLAGLTRLRVPGLEGYAMPSYIAEEFHHAVDQYGAQGLQKAWRQYVMGPWKRWATYRWPGFHVRNFFGAFFNNWLGGVTLEDYVFSWRVNHARDGSLKWAEKKVDAAVMDRVNLRAYFGDVTPTYGEVADLLAEQGVGRANTMAVHGIEGTAEAAREMYSVVGHVDPGPFRRAARRFDGTMREVGSSVEDFHRVAAWATGMSATKGDVYGARAFVMMRHGDYSDLTNAEQYIKDVIPFYKWMRTNVPYQLRMLAENPAQLTLIHDKFRRYAFEAQGLNYDEASLQMPDYLKESLAIPIPSWVPVVGSKDKNALKFALFDLPYADLYNGLDEYMSSALPVARNVLESYGFKQSLFSGTPLTGTYKPLSGVFNLPGVRHILNVAGLTKRGPDGTEYIDDRLQNVLMAWPIFSRFRNFTEASPDRVDARTGGLFSMVAGVGIKAGSYTNAELDFFYNEVQPLLDQYKSLGIQLPTVDDFQSGSVGAKTGLFATPTNQVASPLFAGQAA